MGGVASKRVAVIGGGVSGIAAAHYLLERGFKVDLYNEEKGLGGRMSIDRFEGNEVCFGGKNIGYNYLEFRRFLKRYGRPQYEYFGINSARLSRSKLKPFNSKRKWQSYSNLLEIASVTDLIKLYKAVKATRRDRQNGDLAGPYFSKLYRGNPRTIGSYFSQAFVQSLIRSLTVRMNGAEPHNVSLENFGTHLRMLSDEYEQLTTPLSDIFSSFAQHENISIFHKTRIENVKPLDQGFSCETKCTQKTYSNIVVALPAMAARQILQSDFYDVSHALQEVRYFPVSVIIAKYRKAVFTKNVRALTFGPDSPLSNIGAYGANDLNLVRYTFSGAAAEEILHENLDDDGLLKTGETLSAPYFHIENNPCSAFQVKSWEAGLCGYTLHESVFQARLKQALLQHPGLYLTGDYIKGASIENCFRAAKATVEALIKDPSSVATPPRPKPKSLNFEQDQSYV